MADLHTEEWANRRERAQRGAWVRGSSADVAWCAGFRPPRCRPIHAVRRPALAWSDRRSDDGAATNACPRQSKIKSVTGCSARRTPTR